jgi:hypothetical protein
MNIRTSFLQQLKHALNFPGCCAFLSRSLVALRTMEIPPFLYCLLVVSSALVVSESESYVTTDGQSASLSWNNEPIWGLRLDFYYCQTVAGLMMWGSLWRQTLSFTIAAGPRQRSHSWVRVPWDSRPYFTVSDSRLPFSSPLMTLRATVKVFDPAYTRDNLFLYLRLVHIV